MPDLQEGAKTIANDVMKEVKKDEQGKEPHVEVYSTQETSTTVTP